jgi:hypothetical protein
MSVVTSDAALTPATLRAQLGIHEEIVHSTIEVHYRPGSLPLRTGRRPGPVA